MLEQIFSGVLDSSAGSTFSLRGFLMCTAASLVIGAAIALCYTFRNTYSKGFVITLALLPAIVQMVIMLVNGNLGTGVAVMGAFSLVRFRSAPGSAKEILSLFLSMAVGLATGTGYLAAAAIFAAIICGAEMLYSAVDFGRPRRGLRALRITIPESLNYTDIFDDIFEKYSSKTELVSVKTTAMGSLYKLRYLVNLKDVSKEKEFIDALRCRNGNLEIVCALEQGSAAEL